jgi:Mg-chelatase subunit ChlD
MKPGDGRALFTAECSHTFHFHCIASNVKHGNQNCPICRTKWKEVPFCGSSLSDHPNGQASRINPAVNWAQNDGQVNLLRRLPRTASSNRHQYHHLPSIYRDLDPTQFNDDEPLEAVPELDPPPDKPGYLKGGTATVEVKTFTELSEISQSDYKENFTVLIHLKAPISSVNFSDHGLEESRSTRAPVDLITVLDVSGSMAGTKLALLKRAMGFVIQNLGSSDRLSIIAFSSTARRLFPLRRMSESGRQQSLLAVNSLAANGGTNIAEGLRKGVKIIEDRKEKNPVCSVILLSDGQDTYTVFPTNSLLRSQPDHCALLPASARKTGGHSIPVHVFGFGADHDSESLHSISEASGGTFSFIEAEAAIQDAFAQCIGGLLSVVSQDLHVQVDAGDNEVKLGSIKSGSYTNHTTEDKRRGSIHVGDLYAEEERDFLVSVNVPPAGSNEKSLLMRVSCAYKEPLTKETVNLSMVEVKIARPLVLVSEQVTSIEVDRQRRRLEAAEAMVESRSAAEQGELSKAVSILDLCRGRILESVSGKSGDRLCMALDAELREMQERMADRQRYEASGRAYMLSGLSSHSWQRATARGDSTDSNSLVQAYQTTSMVDMLQRSKTMTPSNKQSARQMRHTNSFPARPEPR